MALEDKHPQVQEVVTRIRARDGKTEYRENVKELKARYKTLTGKDYGA